MIRILVFIALLVVPIVSAFAAEPAPLFQSQETLAITLTGPFRQIDRERNKAKEYEGSLSYQSAAGQEITLDASLEARGNYRLRQDVCRYSQLWVDLKRRQVPDTLFAGQNRLKLVVQCRPQTRYAAYVIKEYLAYRMFDQLTDVGFKVRLVNVTYSYLDNAGESRTHLGLLIENKDTVAERFNTSVVEENRVRVGTLEPGAATLVALFMMMIGNTDFSLASGPEGEECCHNAKLLVNDSAFLPIPYDFDGSGFVNASYAADPNPSFGIRNNRERLYRGYCIHNDFVAATLSVFQSAINDIFAVVSDSRLTPRDSLTATAYLEDFFQLINDPQEVQDKIIDNCRS